MLTSGASQAFRYHRVSSRSSLAPDLFMAVNRSATITVGASWSEILGQWPASTE